MLDIDGRARPTTVQDLKGLALSRTVVLPAQLEKVARFTFERPEEIAFATIRSISTSCDVAPRTVLRLANAFGFESFRDFRRLFNQHLKTHSCDQ